MIPLHSVLPELAARETRHIEIMPAPQNPSTPPPDDYAFAEFYCQEPGCDCRRVFLQVFGKNQADLVFASIGYGWEKESFYRKKSPWDPAHARETIRGELDPLNEQSEFAGFFLEIFRRILDESYRLRLRRHYRMFREELGRRQKEN